MVAELGVAQLDASAKKVVITVVQAVNVLKQ